MAAWPVLEDFLTEFDTRIGAELNIDPLGLLVIWSSYGQKIFRNRISSISNDVRNYTLNLFNHAVTRALIEDDGVVPGKGLSGLYGIPGKDSLEFRQACLIYLENLFTYAMVDAQARPGVETVGVLGISMARKKDKNPWLVFSHGAGAHVLKRQNSLGVSGRYKTPLMALKFFDSRYDYAQPEFQPQWQRAQTQLFQAAGPLAALRVLAQKHLAELVADPQAEPSRAFAEIPAGLKDAYVDAFRSARAVGAYARDFWLALTELNQGAAGALYAVLQDEPQSNGRDPWAPDEVFGRAILRTQAEAERTKLEHVRVLEPFLGELALLLDVLLSATSQTVDEALGQWRRLGRDGSTLPALAGPIEAHASLRAQASGTAADRLKELLALARGTDARGQAEQLIAYHDKVMAARGQSSWLRLLDGGRLKVDVGTRALPEPEERPVGRWVHDYYVPQFRHFLSGLRGQA